MAFTYKRLHISSSGGTGGDSDKIRVSVSDLLSGFLDEKLEVGSTKITKEIINPGNNETLQLDIDETQIDHDNTLNYDVDKHRKMDDNVISLSTIWSSQKTKTYVDDSVQEKDEASEIFYDPSGSSLTSTDVQNAINELDNIVQNSSSTIETRICESTAQVLDLVFEDNTITNKVISAINNTEVKPIVGIIIEKITSTSCKVLLLGTISGFSGLSKGKKVFLGTDGSVTSNVATTGYLQCLGTAKEIDTIIFNPNFTRVKRN